ncbi:MAG: WYL domain-containing protein [Gammaproteobacteria bacterium]|nr:WYL domain-containing protein [Gammaproteobacteria bacterium]
MNQTERIYKITHMLENQQAVTRQHFLDTLEVSPATFKRDIEYMRSRLHAPIVYDRDRGGYRFEVKGWQAPQMQLPGLWFNAQEAHALLAMQHLLGQLQPGLLDPYVKPLQNRIRDLLGRGERSTAEIRNRIRILPQGARHVSIAGFEVIANAVLKRRRLHITYHNRERNEASQRQVSPQRLTHYRDNWYLDAWCHLRNSLRIFALDMIQRAEPVDAPAREVTKKTLDDELASSYGIFSGKARHTAVLRFSAHITPWVANETWHPRQTSKINSAGQLELTIPYSDDRELIMDILKYGPDVDVLEPEALKNRVGEKLQQAVARYG